jgi:hypothetical protein
MNIKYALLSTSYRLSTFHSRGYWTEPRTSNTVRMDQLGNIFSIPVFNIFYFLFFILGLREGGKGCAAPCFVCF